MSVVATVLRELIALGVSGEALIAAVERIEQAAVEERAGTVREAVEIASRRADEALAEKKAKAAARTRRWREGKETSVTVTSPDITSVTVTDGDASTRPLPLSPQTPQSPTPTRECVSTHEREREDAAWLRFWADYPRKTAKADARKAFTKAWKKLPPHEEEGIIVGGLERAKAGWEDAQFIPHAATWLNGERWTDEAVPQPTPRKANDRPDHSADAKLAARHENYARAFAGSESAARSRWVP